MKTAQDWWAAVDAAWDDLKYIIGCQMDLLSPAYKMPGDINSPPVGHDIVTELEHLKDTRNSKLARYFHAAWGLAPESFAWGVTNWGTLCDLCSEEWVLYESDEAEVQDEEIT